MRLYVNNSDECSCCPLPFSIFISIFTNGAEISISRLWLFISCRIYVLRIKGGLVKFWVQSSLKQKNKNGKCHYGVEQPGVSGSTKQPPKLLLNFSIEPASINPNVSSVGLPKVYNTPSPHDSIQATIRIYKALIQASNGQINKCEECDKPSHLMSVWLWVIQQQWEVFNNKHHWSSSYTHIHSPPTTDFSQGTPCFSLDQFQLLL